MINTEISHQSEKISSDRVPMSEISAERIIKALYRLPSEYLPHILQYIEFLEYKFTYTSSDPFEDEALWDAAQAEMVRKDMNPRTVQMWIFAHNGLTSPALDFAEKHGILWSSRKEFDELLVHLGLRPLPEI